MKLSLEVLNKLELLRGGSRSKTFGAAGGSIGRTPNNDWCLPAPGVSRQHAAVHFADGRFLIEDCSSNGMALNGGLLPKRQPQPLRTGDRLTIDEFEIAVSVAEAPEPVQARGLSGSLPLHDLGGVAPAVDSGADLLSAAEQGPLSLSAHTESADPLHLLLGGDATPPAEAPPLTPPASSWNHSPNVSDHFTPPVATAAPPIASAGGIPEDWDLNASQVRPQAPAIPVIPPPPPQLAKPAPPPQIANPPPAQPRAMPSTQAPALRTVVPGTGSGGSLDHMLSAAGLDPATVAPETMQEMGEILRVVVEGMVEALRVRAQTKSEFRLDQTRAQARGNNPLKFAANFEDAMYSLFQRKNPAYLGAVDAFRDAFDDLHAHQVAMLAGFRDAFECVLREFDPARLRPEFDAQLKAMPLVLASKSKYWELYESRFVARAADAEDAFRELFGEPFAEAYEKQFRAIKNANKERK